MHTKEPYPSSFTEQEWALIEPPMPGPSKGNYILDSEFPWQRHPRRLISWMEMNKFSANGFYVVSQFLERFKIAAENLDHAARPTPESVEETKKILGLVANGCRWINLRESAAFAEEMASTLSAEWSPDYYRSKFESLNTLLQIQMRQHLFLWIPEDRAAGFDAPLSFWGVASDCFSSAQYDMTEAKKCFALDRFTASVLHSMRILEIGLRALAESLNVPFGERDWRGVLNALQKEWKRRENLRRKPANWKRDRQFYSEAFVEFGYLKDAWRNYAMHARERYDEERAETIMLHVGSLMRHLATKLKE